MGLLDEFLGAATNFAQNSFNDMMTANAEKTDVLQYGKNLESILSERGIVDMNSPEAVDATIEALHSAGADGKPDSVLGRYYKLIMERDHIRRQPLATNMCQNGCTIDRCHCEECIALMKQAHEAIGMVSNPELYQRQCELASTQNKDMECSFCGAPMEETETVCDYCGTKRASNQSLKIQRNAFGELPSAVVYAAQAIHAYRMFHLMHVEDYLFNAQLLSSELTVKYGYYTAGVDMPTINNAVNAIYSAEGKRRIRKGIDVQKVAMSERDVYQAASKTNLPIEVYLRAYFEGQVGNLATLLLEDELEREKQRNKEERERINRDLEKIRIRAEQSREETQKLIYQQQLERASRAGSGYNGGGGSGSGGHCCGGCALYNTNNATCSRTGSRRSATEYCGWFTWK